jgi:hypothetical protein
VYDGVYMEIEHVTLNDAGRYTCLAENPAGRDENYFDIDVSGRFNFKRIRKKYFIFIFLVPPLFNDSLTDVKILALVNTTVKLGCSAYGFPKPVIDWSFNTKLLLKNQSEEEFIIEHVQVGRFIRL